jgi:hypothetical protein
MERRDSRSYIESQVFDKSSLAAIFVQNFDVQAPIRGSRKSRPTLTPCDSQNLPAIVYVVTIRLVGGS